MDLKINDYSLTTTGIIDKDILIFKDSDYNCSYNLIDHILIRENNEIIIKQFFSKNSDNLEIVLKTDNKKVFDNLNNLSLHQTSNPVIINYRVGDIDYHFSLSYKEIV